MIERRARGNDRKLISENRFWDDWRDKVGMSNCELDVQMEKSSKPRLQSILIWKFSRVLPQLQEIWGVMIMQKNVTSAFLIDNDDYWCPMMKVDSAMMNCDQMSPEKSSRFSLKSIDQRAGLFRLRWSNGKGPSTFLSWWWWLQWWWWWLWWLWWWSYVKPLVQGKMQGWGHNHYDAPP